MVSLTPKLSHVVPLVRSTCILEPPKLPPLPEALGGIGGPCGGGENPSARPTEAPGSAWPARASGRRPSLPPLPSAHAPLEPLDLAPSPSRSWWCPGWGSEASDASDGDAAPTGAVALHGSRPRQASGALVSAGGAAAVRLRLERLPSLAKAARARKERTACPVRKRPIASYQFIRQSELGPEGRRAVQAWALGRISGQQCMLRLELAEAVVQLLGGKAGLGETEQDEELSRVALWAVGCIRLGDTESRLQGVRTDLEDKSPAEVLQEARDAVHKECGGDGEEELAVDDMNWEWALHRLAMRAHRSSDSDPAAAVRVQVWRELLRVHLGMAMEEHGDDSRECLQIANGVVLPTAGHLEHDADDTAMLAWLRRTEHEIREAASAYSPVQLQQEADRLLEYVEQTIRVAAWLREALEGWQRFDPYRIIGVRRGCTRAEVKRCFYKKALLLHPDKGGDKAAFQELQRAYDEILRELDGKADEEGQDAEEDEAERSSDDSPRFHPNRRQRAEAKQDAKERERGAGAEGAAARQPGKSGHDADETPEGQLGWLARAALDAAEGAGQCATEALQHCREARDAFEEEPVDWDSGRENADVGLTAAKAVAEAGTVVAQLLRKMDELLRSRLADAPAGEEPGEAGQGLEVLQGAAELAREGAGRVNVALGFCLQTLAESTITVYQDDDGALTSRCSEDSGETAAERRLASRACEAMVAVARAAKQLAVVALDAAEAAAGACARAQEADRSLLEETEVQEDLDGSRDEGCSPRGAPGRPGSPRTASPDAEAQRRLEASHAVSQLHEAVRMLRCTNQELLRLQRSAQELTAAQAAAAAPAAVFASRGERALALLAEFLDEAAVGFQAALQDAWSDDGECWPDVFQSFTAQALKATFGFILHSTPDLAVPPDPRAQTLRAAAALDSEAVVDMLRTQVLPRLRSSVVSAVLDAACGEGATRALEDPELLEEAGLLAVERALRQLLEAVRLLGSRGAPRSP